MATVLRKISTKTHDQSSRKVELTSILEGEQQDQMVATALPVTTSTNSINKKTLETNPYTHMIPTRNSIPGTVSPTPATQLIQRQSPHMNPHL